MVLIMCNRIEWDEMGCEGAVPVQDDMCLLCSSFTDSSNLKALFQTSLTNVTVDDSCVYCGPCR